MDKTQGMILIEGNAAAAIGCMMAGVTFVGWYPITPVLLALRIAHRLPEEVPQGSGYREGDVRGGAGRGRDCRARHGHRRRLDGRAVDDLNGRSRRLAHGRVHRPRLLRRSTGRDLRRAARRPVDRVCRPARPSRMCSRPLSCPMATRSTRCCFPRRLTSATRWRWTPSTSPNASRRRSSC